MKNSKLRRKHLEMKAAALVLAVPLWIAGGGVASADIIRINVSDEKQPVEHIGDSALPTGATVSPAIGATAKKTLTITGGDWSGSWEFNGGWNHGYTVTDFTLKLSDVKSTQGSIDIYGGKSDDMNVRQNTVEGTNLDISGSIYGGLPGAASAATNNVVRLTDSRVRGSVWGGGNGQSRLASLNRVTLDNTTVDSMVVGGSAGHQGGNVVTLKNSTVKGGVYGSYYLEGYDSNSEKNVLILSGVNTAGSVHNFEYIQPAFEAAWNENAPLISAETFENISTMEFIYAERLAIHTQPGTMPLLQSGTEGNFYGLQILYFNVDGELTAETPSLIVSSGEEQEKTVNGVTLSYNRNTHTVALADNGKKVNYIVGDKYSSATLGEMNWADSGYTFTAPETIDPKGLTVSFADNFKVAGAENHGNDETLTLLDLSSTLGKIGNSDSKNVTVVLPETEVKTGLKFAATRTDTATATAGEQKVLYATGATSKVTTATFAGEIAWDAKTPYYDAKETPYRFDGDTAINAAGLTVTGTATENPMNQSMTLIANAAGVTGDHLTASPTGYGTIAVDYTNDEKIRFAATAGGEVGVAEDAVNYTVNNVTANRIDLSSWTGAASAIPDGWTAQQNIPVETGAFTVPDDLMAGASRTILSADAGTFSAANISGQNVYRTVSGSDTKYGVTLTGTGARGVCVEGNALVYRSGDLTISGVAVDEVNFAPGGTLRPVSNNAVHYDGVSVDFSKFSVKNPTDVAANQSMTLLAANDSLADMAKQVKTQTYSVSPVQGVNVKATLTGNVSVTDHNAVYSDTKNNADAISFGQVAWQEGGTLLDHAEKLNNVSFAGAAVDASHITFAPDTDLSKGGTMTLIANYDANGGVPGRIDTGVYYLGSTLQGEGTAKMDDGNNLIFNVDSQPDTPQPQTHRTVMGSLVGMAALSMGNDFIGGATEGLAVPSNIGADGVSTYAKMGGGSVRQETGSHVDIHTWNAIIALGHQNKKERSTTEYGAFFEYGSGNYTTYDDEGRRGDGSMHYTGGGLLAKWTAKHGIYVEGSLRAGTIHNDANNMLRDGAGVPYSFSTNTGYFGGHLGIGKEISLVNGNAVDVYGKYYYNRRNDVSFDAGGHYDLDAVTSQVLSVGARYILKREKWDFYAGAAYEHEMDGKATGRANGVAISGADTGGGSFKMELGAKMNPEGSPWSLDLNLTGFAGKKRGVTGGVSVAFMF